MKKFIVGNWKMNGSLAANDALMQGILAGVGQPACDVAVCVPSVYLSQLQGLLASQQAIALGSQNVSQHENGPYTGDVSAEMLKEFGVRYAIVGHSERRMHQAETDTNVAIKAKRALEAGITPIVCVGETQRERDEGMTDYIVRRQLAAVTHLVGSSITEVVVAYEPVWAIGTGNTATPEQAQQVHAVLRKQLQAATNHQASAIRLLYGGSMNAGNAAELLAQPDIDGGLIGGAALKADDFLRIIAAAQ
ncbi:MAG: triose-phosphate isomerase [Brachymonas sp.]|jgi:triosephosphate isomerase|nr:triose-phosphate isomerase [Brachymonas sp.]